MSASFSKLIQGQWRKALIILLWVLFGFVVAQILVGALVWFLDWLGVPLIAIGPELLQSVAAVTIYILALAIIIGFPWAVRHYRVSLKELGLDRLPFWKDIGLAPLAFVIYMVIAGTVLTLLSSFFPGLDLEQAQDVGFDQLTDRTGYLLAFLTLVVVAPFAEEVLFRGYLYGKLRGYIPMWAAIFATSLLFAVAHGQLNVGIDTFILSVALCGLREITGSIWAGILLHVLKNSVAFYIVFVNPSAFAIIAG